MSWIPADFSQACAVYTTVTSCSPASLLFLRLVATVFGQSRDVNTALRTQAYPEQQTTTTTTTTTFNHNNINAGKEYDFIIVGAGTAGCVVTNRLSEVAGWNVLLLEAGDEEPEVVDVPSFAPLLQRSSVDWGYQTQPSPHSCRSRRNGRCLWSRGKVMGGSSALNYMIYMRGSPLDYDEWAGQGNPGWKYSDVLPYFIKSEDNRNPEYINPAFHGTGGYQTVEQFPYQDANINILLQGYRELGLEEFDLNSDRQIGSMLLQHTSRNGERLTTNGAFIRPIRDKRSNLEIRTRSTVMKVLIDPKTNVAYGVEYLRDGKVENAYARKEVILSAGSIDSPKLLMLSGVGPSEQLQSLGIDVLKDLSVGYNLHDHTTIDGVLFSLTNQTATMVNDAQQRAELEYYKTTHEGPLSATGSLQVNAMVQTKYAGAIRPDIQYSMDPANINNFITDPILTAETGVRPLAYYDGMMVRPILLNPRSRGVVMLNRTDPIFGSPLIYANTFKERVDLLTMIEGIKQSLNLLKTVALQSAGIDLVTTPLPGCIHLPFGSDEYWACICMEYTTTIFHPVGTCKMGPSNDDNAVVDASLRVYGISNLRVIDSSIMPIVPRGNTNAPTIMIAEKGSDMIKERWLKTGDSFTVLSQYDVTEPIDNCRK